MSTIFRGHRRVRITAHPEQPFAIGLDGHDVSGAVEAYQITHAAVGHPHVTLHVTPGSDGVEFEGLAEVVAEPAALHRVVVDFLNSVEWQRLDAAVLERDDLDGSRGELTRGVLAQLKEWAAGA